MTQADVMRYLQDKQKATSCEIEQALGKSNGYAYRKLLSFSKHGWVEIKNSEERNSNLYVLTEKGNNVNPERLEPPKV